jgi:undecaprenyl phosphate-alpha-L-ara4N flippase subunit ArnE
MKSFDIFLTVLTAFFLSVTQVALKLLLQKANGVSLSSPTQIVKLIFTPEFAITGFSFLASGLMWMYLLRKIELSLLYPLISVSYIFGLLAAMIVFREDVSINRWIGVAVIIVGVVLVAKK